MVTPEVERGILTIADSPPWNLTLVVKDQRYEATGVDLFDALSILRVQLDAAGVRICVEGARADVFPSGMSRQSSGGRRAYRLVAGRTPEREDLVDIFESTQCGEVVSVSDQLASVQRIRSSG